MSDKELYVLGINAYDHDVSACLLRNGEIVVAIEKERITRIKHASGFYQEVIDYCLNTANITYDRVDLVVRNCYVQPVEKVEQRLTHQDWPNYLNQQEREQAAASPLFLTQSDRVVTISHHLAHAFSAFAVSPFDEGAVMVVDGVGNYHADVTEPVPADDIAHPMAREAESYYTFSKEDLKTLKKVWMGPTPGFLNDEFYMLPGLGALYSRVSTYIFGDWNKCGEVMGLAPYGRSNRFDPLLRINGGRLEVPEWSAKFRHPWLGFDDSAWEKSPWRVEWEDLAWRVQEDTEQALLERVNWLHKVTGARNLCIAGGVALNCVANGRIVRETPFDQVWIQPAAGDNGIAIGCAYYGHLALLNQKRKFVMKHAYLGRPYDNNDEAQATKPWHVRFAMKHSRETKIAARTAAKLVEGNVVGWFQGRSEFGPRALGNRSILTDPRPMWMKDHVNARVKHRQSFRPFAPAVLAERAHEIFEGDQASPFMLLAKKVRPQWQDKIPAVVHVDGTARVQTVSKEDNPRFHALINSFAELTGVPVLLNTSFNIRGEPIVEQPLEAMDCFLFTGIDVLVIHDTLFQKRWTYRAFFPLIRFVTEVRRNLRVQAWME